MKDAFIANEQQEDFDSENIQLAENIALDDQDVIAPSSGEEKRALLKKPRLSNRHGQFLKSIRRSRIIN